MREKTYVEDIDRNKYDFRYEEKDASRMVPFREMDAPYLRHR